MVLGKETFRSILKAEAFLKVQLSTIISSVYAFFRDSLRDSWLKIYDTLAVVMLEENTETLKEIVAMP